LIRFHGCCCFIPILIQASRDIDLAWWDDIARSGAYVVDAVVIMSILRPWGKKSNLFFTLADKNGILVETSAFINIESNRRPREKRMAGGRWTKGYGSPNRCNHRGKMKKQTFRVVTRDKNGDLKIRDFDSEEDLMRRHIQIGIDDCSTDLSLRGRPVFRGLIGPMPETGSVIRYESPEVFEVMTKEWSIVKKKRRSRKAVNREL
jgi:hypothetical protein